MAFDPMKPVQTRDGGMARIVCTDAKGAYPIVALIKSKYGDEITARFSADGTKSDHYGYSLVNVPERKTLWGNVYRGDVSNGFPSKRDANRVCAPDRIGLVSLTFEGGRLVSFENHPIDGGGDD